MKEPIVPQFSGEEYLRWEEARPDKYELHHGFVVAFAGGTIEHDDVAYRLRKVFERTYPRPCRTFGSDVKIRASEQLYFYCDAGVICEFVEGKQTYIDRPRIVGEVLSRSTRAYDLVEKRAAYRSLPSVEAYVVIHTDMRRVEVDSRGSGGRWQTAIYDDDDEVLLAGQNVALADIYGHGEYDADAYDSNAPQPDASA